jgi:NRAMP (natural resistance-associated macrophage protein)-like metal ion transporter
MFYLKKGLFKMNIVKRFFKDLGPGVITGAADDDPSGIATYTQTGAQFGYGMLWTAVFMLPMLASIQEACARIGAVTGEGIAAILKQHFNKKILYGVVFLVLIANIINIGADIGAMAAATKLIVPANTMLLSVLFTIFILTMEIFVSYRAYANILKWLCLSLLAYPLTVFMVKEDWGQVLKATFIPHLEFNFQFLFIITGVLGTTISPYLFFWQASEEVEEVNQAGLKKHHSGRTKLPQNFIRKLRIDNFAGMLFSEIATWSIIVVGAAVLHAHGITDVKSAADAAKALEPFVQGFPHAGYLAQLIFAIGIVGLGLIAVPVLAGSAAYAFGEVFNWKIGLDLKLKHAPQFYGIIILATVVGLLLNFTGVNPIKALVYAAVINGVVAVPLIFLIALIARNEKIMGKYKSGKLSQTLVAITFIGMAVAAIAMFATAGKS